MSTTRKKGRSRATEPEPAPEAMDVPTASSEAVDPSSKPPTSALLSADDLSRNATGDAGEFALLDADQIIKTQALKKLLAETRKFKEMFIKYNELVNEHPTIAEPTTEEERKKEAAAEVTVTKARNLLLAQLTVVKTINRQAVMQTRAEKQKTAEAKQEVDKLRLGLQNLTYEQQSLKREISAAQNYDHKYTKLPLISLDDFLEKFPEHQDKPEAEVMAARIEHEHQERVQLEERRQEKLKMKLALVTEVKNRKEDLGKLDESLERFIAAAAPIQETLDKE